MHLCHLSKWSTAFYLAPMFSSHHSRAQTHRVEVKTAMHTRNFQTWFFFNSLGLNHTLQPPLHTCNQQKKHIFTGSSRLLQLLQQHVLCATHTSCTLDPAIAAIAACPIDPHFHGYIINVFGILKGEYNTIQGAVQWHLRLMTQCETVGDWQIDRSSWQIRLPTIRGVTGFKHKCDIQTLSSLGAYLNHMTSRHERQDAPMTILW